jgi:hypothetical protein
MRPSQAALDALPRSPGRAVMFRAFSNLRRPMIRFHDPWGRYPLDGAVIRYGAIGAFHERDIDLCQRIRQAEIEFFDRLRCERSDR